MKFIKAETNGNDFIIIQKSESGSCDIKKIANRRTGVGCDQVIIFEETAEEVFVEFFNQDGSTASFCGNGLCALTRYISETANSAAKINYLINGVKYTGYYDQATQTASVETPMPTLISEYPDYKIVDTGNKHLVCLIRDDNLLSQNDEFNIHFVTPLDPNALKIETYERGVGKTLACGSGAIASSFVYGQKNQQTKIIHEGGVSCVFFKKDTAILKTRPNLVFSGCL